MNIIIILMLLIFSQTSFAATYYVATTGSDTVGTGAIGAPWATPLYGVSRLSANDTIILRGGTYQVTTTATMGQSAAIVPPADNITIKAYSGETVTLVGNGGVMPTNGVIGDFDGTNKRDGTIIDGLTIQGIVVMEATGTIVKNCDISIGGDSWSGIGQGEVIWVQGCSNCVIQNNRLHDNSLRGVQYTNSALIMVYLATNLVIENNDIYNSGGPAMTLKDSQTNTIVRKNFIYNNAYGGAWMANQANAGTSTGTRIYQNIFKGNNTSNSAEYGAITFVTLATDIEIYNNTFYANKVADFNKWTSVSMPAKFLNNISSSPVNSFLSWPYGAATFTFTTIDYNNYYTTGTPRWVYQGAIYSTLDAWKVKCNTLLAGGDSHSINTDPQFLNETGTFSLATDFKRSVYAQNGIGGTYPLVMGAYITGGETIGFSTVSLSGGLKAHVNNSWGIAPLKTYLNGVWKVPTVKVYKNSQWVTWQTIPIEQVPDYYVATSGCSDSYNGTSSATPWCTVGKVNNTAFVAGKVIGFRKGDTWYETLIPRTGTSTSPIVYTSYGTATAKPTLSGVNAMSRSYATIKNLKLSSGTGTVVLLAGASYITIDSCEVYSTYGSWSPAIYLYSSNFMPSGASHHNTVKNSIVTLTVSNVMNDAINLRAYANYNLFEGNTITVSGGHNATATQGASLSADGQGTADYNVFRNNIIYSYGGSSYAALENGKNNLLDGNILIGWDHALPYVRCGQNSGLSQARTQGGLTIDSTNNIVRRNIIKSKTCLDSRGIMLEANGGWPVTGNHVYNNLVTNVISGGQGVYIGNNSGGTSNNYIKNNIFYNVGGYLFQTMQDGSATAGTENMAMLVAASYQNYFNNNLFYKDSIGSGAVTWVDGSPRTVAALQTAYPSYYVGNIQQAPLLNAAHAPLVGSPTIDAGATLTTVTSATNSVGGNTFTVADAGWFFSGFGWLTGDTIQVGSQTATITGISGNTITVGSVITWTNGAAVSLPYNGSAPDIGVYEY